MTTRLDKVAPINNISSETLRTAVEESRSPLILTDYSLEDNPIVYSNEAFLDLTGYAMDEIVGRNCRFLQGQDSDQEAVGLLRDAVKEGKPVRVEIKNYKKDGTPFWNDLLMSPIRDASGNITHFMGMQVDTTRRVQDEENLKRKTQELESSNIELEQFTYATSHDLQEPLRMINSYLQLIKKRYGQILDEDATKYLNFATEGADRMQDLIHDLLTLSRVTSSTDTFRKISMNTVLDRVLRNLRVSIDEAEAVVEVGGLPEYYADPVQMTQLFQNLISNGIKYRRKNEPPNIKITAVTGKQDIVFGVSDNGIGIDEKYFDRIFVVFQRLHTRNEYAGTGIGLAICTRIVERHGGRIWVESVKGRGSTFKISLPLDGGKD